MNNEPKPANNLPKLAAPAQRALAGVGVKRLDHLTKFSEDDVKQLHGIGPNALVQLRRALANARLSFARSSSSKKGRQGSK